VKEWRRDIGQSNQARRFFEACQLNVHQLPDHVKITIPREGGFWLTDRRTGLLLRRVTMEDLPKQVTWNTRGKAKSV